MLFRSSETIQEDDNNAYEIMQKHLETAIYRESAKKIVWMMRRFEEDGYTSYWL